MITQDLVESLHGHNYYLEIELFGKLNSNGMIFNYLSLDKSIKAIILEWDHYTLLPRLNKQIKYEEKGDNIEIRYGDRFYSIPTNEIRFLECQSVTTEVLNELFLQRIKVFLNQKSKPDNIKMVKVTIWETPMYAASRTICL